MGDLNYVYAVGRIRVKEKSLLSDSDIGQMIGLKDEAAVISYLQDKGWGSQDSGKDPDRILSAEEAKAWGLMVELGIAPSVFEVLSYPHLYHNLKAGIKEICTGGGGSRAFSSAAAAGCPRMWTRPSSTPSPTRASCGKAA